MSAERVSSRAAVAAAIVAAAIYVHFLIFAEFALLEIATSVNGSAPGKLQLLPLVVSGILGGSITAALLRPANIRGAIAFGLAVCAASAALAAMASTPSHVLAATALAGFGLGVATVSFSGSAHRLFAGRRLGVSLGAATGAAYAFCNVPALFDSEPRVQSAVAAIVALAGAVAALFADAHVEPSPAAVKPARFFWTGVGVLFVLVWFDSAAFFQIQHSEALKAVTWTGSAQLWANAALHLAAAVAAGLLLDAGRARTVLVSAGALLAAAVLALLAAPRFAAAGHLLYPAGVSFYSVALIAWPASTRGVRTPAHTAIRAAFLFSVAGWLGSAAGIGMVLDLGRLAPVPCAIAAAAFIVLLSWRGAWRAIAVAAALTFAMRPGELLAAEETDTIAAGRRVYIAEGCIHCHSQFVRPGTRDETAWGPVAPLESLLAAAPPLPGNRRQGPDLQNSGLRRSREWNRLHLIDPRAVSPGSRMPSYAHLFAESDSRGEALLDYLASLGTGLRDERAAQIVNWRPVEPAADAAHGRALFARNCAQCHGVAGRGDGPLAARLALQPRDLVAGKWRFILLDDDAALARLIKFGMPGTSMPGHEAMSDADIGALTVFVRSLKMHAKRDENPPG